MKLSKKSIHPSISFLWALSEATFFFIIPDVWLSFMSLEDLRKGFKNILFALMGAVLGGSIMYFLGKQNISAMTVFLDHIPDSNMELITKVEESIKSEGFWAVFQGPFRGIPYKIYASFYGALSMNYFVFLLISIPARAIRFIVTVLTTNFVSTFMLKNCALKTKKILLIVVWFLIYILVFLV